MNLSGSFNHQLDAKGRLRIPYKFKPLLGDGCVLTKCSNGSLMVLSGSQYRFFAEKYKVDDISDFDKLKVSRAFFASVATIEEDNQGRFVLDAKLKKFAGINKNVVFVGLENRVELWAEERWLDYNNDSDDSDSFDASLTASRKNENG